MKKKIVKLIVVILTYFFITKAFLYISLRSSNKEFIKGMLKNSNYYSKYEEHSFIKYFTKYILNIDFNEPKNILESVFNYKLTDNKVDTKYVLNETKNKVYIYNTHQTESYQDENLNDYNISPTVLMASYLLEGLLEKENISVLVEERKMSDYLKQNGLNYDESYKASRSYLLDTIKKDNYDLIIDLHRDATPYNVSTTSFNNKKYAKFLFVIGSNHVNYQKNYELANRLNEKIKKINPNLTRGILVKPRSIFNQDVSDKDILIECGGNENRVDEVMNSIIVLKDVIKEYIGEINEEKK